MLLTVDGHRTLLAGLIGSRREKGLTKIIDLCSVPCRTTVRGNRSARTSLAGASTPAKGRLWGSARSK